MFRAIILAVGLCSAVAMTAAAADGDKKPEGKRPPLTEEQKALRKEMTEKYDTNKDGKLSADERKGISAGDQEKMAKAGLGPRRRQNDAK
jgi:hypothetical protein